MGTGFSGLYNGDSSSSPKSKPGLGLEDIPEGCVALILSYLDPPDICRSAGLSQTFHRASSADFIWESKLPENYQILVKKVLYKDQRTEEINLVKKDIYAMLSAPNRLDGGNKEVWLDKNIGGLCVCISWKGLKITGIDDRRYWNHVSSDDSRFQTIAYLQQIWWLEVAGDLEFEFPAGTYSLFFRLQLGRDTRGHDRRGTSTKQQVHGWDIKPVHFQISTSNGQKAISQCYLREQGRWLHYHVGDFLVDNSSVPTNIKFSMSQIDCTHTKGGLCLDSVLICPRELGHILNHRS